MQNAESIRFVQQENERLKDRLRFMRRLYQDTQERIRDSVQILAEQAHERMLGEEQLTVGWEQGS